MSLPSLVAALVALPAIVGAILILITRTPLRNALVVIGGIAIGILAVATVISFGNTSGVFFGLPGGLAPGKALIAVEIALTIFVVVISLMNRRFLAPLLAGEAWGSTSLSRAAFLVSLAAVTAGTALLGSSRAVA